MEFKPSSPESNKKPNHESSNGLDTSFDNKDSSTKTERLNQTSEKQRAAILLSVTAGKELQSEYPDIADDFRSGMTYREITTKYQLQEKYSAKLNTVRAILRNALRGYDGRSDWLKELNNFEPYSGLIAQEKYNKLLSDHHKRSVQKVGLISKNSNTGIFSLSTEKRSEISRKAGLGNKANGIGIFGLDTEARKSIAQKAIRSQGNSPFSNQEIETISTLSKDPEYQRGTRRNLIKIAETLNERFHSGKSVRTALSVEKALLHRNPEGTKSYVPYSEEEIDYAEKLSYNPLHQHKDGRKNLNSIAQILNEVFHDSRAIRNAKSLKNALRYHNRNSRFLNS